LRAHLRLVAVADRVDEQLPQRGLTEDLAEHVEDLAAQRLALLVELGEQLVEHVALARLQRHEVPQVAHLGLADAVDAAEALLQPVRVPGQVVVDHQVRPLQVQAFAGGVGRQQDLHSLILREGILHLASLLAPHPAVDHDHRLRPPEQRGDAVMQVGQRVTVLGEDDELAPTALRVEHLVIVLQQARELVPLAVRPGLPHPHRQFLQSTQRGDLDAQLGDRTRRRGLVGDLLLDPLHLRIRRVVQVVDVLLGEGRHVLAVRRMQAFLHTRAPHGAAALLQLLLPQPLLQPLTTPAQRLVDGLRRRGQATLQDGQGEADRVATPPLAFLHQPVGAVHLLAHVLCHLLIEHGFAIRQRVGDGGGDALGEQRRIVELNQFLLDQPAHQVGRIRLVDTVAEAALEAVGVKQGHE